MVCSVVSPALDSAPAAPGLFSTSFNINYDADEHPERTVLTTHDIFSPDHVDHSHHEAQKGSASSPTGSGSSAQTSQFRGSKTMMFDSSGWPDHSGETWYERLQHLFVVGCLLLKWAVQLIIAAGPMRIIRWLWLGFRLISFVTLLLWQVFLPMAWVYATSGSILRDVPYNNDEHSKGRAVLDIFLPRPAYQWIAEKSNGKDEKKRPAIIFFCGGAWIVGYKAWGALLARVLAAAGVICFVPDYRNFPQATISDMISDTNDAIAWVLANVETYGGDPNRVLIIGQSAGAHLSLSAMLLQVRNRLYREQGMVRPCVKGASWNPSSICGYVGISGPYDVAGLADHFQSKGLYKSVLEEIFEGFEEQLSPAELLGSLDGKVDDVPPVYLYHGTKDDTVPHESSLRFAEQLADKRLRVACKMLEGYSHTSPIIESPVGGDDPLMLELMYLVMSKTPAQLPPTGGFTGTTTLTELIEETEGEKKMKEVSSLVPRANKMLLKLAGVINPF